MIKPSNALLQKHKYDDRRDEQKDRQKDKCNNLQGYWLKSGDTCPNCNQGILDYDGMLNLTCPSCGMTETGGCFT